jgi:hypothetical protein
MERPSLFRKNTGGRLNGVEGTITGYELTTVFPFGEGKSKFEGTPIYAVLTVRPDGADEDIIEPLKAGKEEDFTINDDCLSLTPANEGQGIHPSSKFGKFLAGMIENSKDLLTEEDLGFTNWPENRLDFSRMIGARVRFTRVKDAELQEKFGPKKYKAKDGTSKEADRDYLTVAEVYSVAPVRGAKGAAKGKAKVETVDVNAIADDVTAAVVEKKGGTLNRNRLSAELQVMKGKYPSANGEWKDIAALVMTPAYLIDAAERGIINYDEKKQVLTSAS